MSSILPVYNEKSPLVGRFGSGIATSSSIATSSRKPIRRRFLVRILVGALFIFALLNLYPRNIGLKAERRKKKNIVFFVTDGMGPASLSLARSFKQFRDGLPYNETLFLDQHLIGSSRTRSSSSLVTDSAAGATAFSCALKSYNGAIGVDPAQNPCGTVLESLKTLGYYTGLVVTTRITDATPAAFSSHVNYRSQEDLIAEHQLGYYPLGRSVDLIMGGGRCHYHGCRSDDRNLIKEAVNDGWKYIGNRTEFDSLNLENTSLPLLGLFADNDIPFDLDRDSALYPSLQESAIAALKILHDNSMKDDDSNGFFIMIEGSRIDHGGHFNDPVAQANEVLAFDKAFKAVAEFADSIADDADTIMLSTSDHETGGLSVSKQLQPTYPDYIWYPEILVNAKKTSEYVTKKIMEIYQNTPEKISLEFLTDLIASDFGVEDLTTDEVQLVLSNISSPQDSLVTIINKRAQIGWSTHGHSAVDVNIYGYSPSEDYMKLLLLDLLGNHENIEVGKFLSSIDTNVDLDKITKRLKNLK